MRATLRRLLLVLLMLALPLQGVAAASMRLCEAMHGSGGAVASIDLHAVHRMTVPSEPVSSADVVQDCHQSLAGDAASIDDPADTDATTGSCSACAVCCLAAVAAPAVPDVGHPRLGGVQASAAAVPEAGGLPERLERPPRSA